MLESRLGEVRGVVTDIGVDAGLWPAPSTVADLLAPLPLESKASFLASQDGNLPDVQYAEDRGKSAQVASAHWPREAVLDAV
ncbi:hypothetical protein CBOM_01148 [Ceraceosorus bombacis]|uniref:Uncharacterized protein n=1 Tax=Ceraceosorus bombacis TaxID=401625 RepID=A0A0P1BCF9_9BASI|nr:hypothetical protein CBOM_01148 [Ceraceosorus bombacis]